MLENPAEANHPAAHDHAHNEDTRGYENHCKPKISIGHLHSLEIVLFTMEFQFLLVVFR
jgi:hypothetical protein